MADWDNDGFDNDFDNDFDDGFDDFDGDFGDFDGLDRDFDDFDGFDDLDDFGGREDDRDGSDEVLGFLLFNELVNKGRNRGRGGGGCYIATCVYGSYDCPEVWTLRRFRDRVLRRGAAGRLFVRCYYALSPRLVRRFGASGWFRRFWRGVLDRAVARLRARGLEDTPYRDE